MTPPTLPYGEWPSPITPEAVVAAAASPGEVRAVADEVFWSESRPAEGGRVQVVRWRSDGPTVDLLPDGWSARTRVHEYGGAAWLATTDWLYFVSWDDQRLHRLALGPDGRAGEPEPLTPEPAIRGGDRYADADLVGDGDFLVCVREHHDGVAEAVNDIVAIATDGTSPPRTLVRGPDFVAAPRVSPDGDQLAWIQWDHPDMPWDATELVVAPLVVDDADPVPGERGVSIGEGRVVAGGRAVARGRGESVIQPQWRADGVLHFLSDRTEWWNIYADRTDGVAAVTHLGQDIGTPPWVFGMSRYAFLADGQLVFAASHEGLDQLHLANPVGAPTPLPLAYTEIASVVAQGRSALFVGAGFDTEAVVAALPVGDDGPGPDRVLRPPRPLPVGAEWFSVASPVSFASGPDGDRVAHALHYPPHNPEVAAPEGEAPPLLVLIHGGPTGMARARLDLAKQFWTSRGFAVVDVNYGGSTGFGRPYRELLQGQWGVVDVEDCIAAACHLADLGEADPDRLCIRGGSAGGFTVLAALVASDTFAAGACSYGVADLTALAEETHKFESRYLDGLVGPYPEAKPVYDERSPINHVDRLDRPLIVFQGLEDEIVPPNQSEMIVEALRARGVPVAYLAFEGEQHGFRRAETVVSVLGSELAFYGRVLGFQPAGELPDVSIDNL
ncbi:MAG: prolyl oligopeptidase family serine peptidase [Acidimicrobiales bacterium]|nr:prolyl oligopeptidase family serine peptidase [Acidimicrobiales bacterium]